MSVRQTLNELSRQQKKAFIPYITAGDPTLEATAQFVKALARAGAHIIELGLPFSDPVADGPVNQRASERALQKGCTLKKVFALVQSLRQDGLQTPLVLFTYFNPLYRMGLETFARAAKDAGLNAVLVVDLPPEEATEYRAILARAGLECVFLASPTTAVHRLKLINEASTAFLYYVSRTGVTGTQSALSQSLAQEISDIKKHVQSSIAVGFGISTPEQVQSVAKFADGVIVGSALVKIIEAQVLSAEKAGLPFAVEKTAEQLENFTKQLVQALKT